MLKYPGCFYEVEKHDTLEKTTRGRGPPATPLHLVLAMLPVSGFRPIREGAKECRAQPPGKKGDGDHDSQQSAHHLRECDEEPADERHYERDSHKGEERLSGPAQEGETDQQSTADEQEARQQWDGHGTVFLTFTYHRLKRSFCPFLITHSFPLRTQRAISTNRSGVSFQSFGIFGLSAIFHAKGTYLSKTLQSLFASFSVIPTALRTCLSKMGIISGYIKCSSVERTGIAQEFLRP